MNNLTRLQTDRVRPTRRPGLIDRLNDWVDRRFGSIVLVLVIAAGGVTVWMIPELTNMVRACSGR